MIDLFHDEIPEASIVEDPSSFQKCFRVNSISIESMLRNAFVCRAHTNVCCLLDRQHGAEKFGATKSRWLPILRSPQTNFELDQSPMGFLKVAL
jgi:hypothetical protein